MAELEDALGAYLGVAYQSPEEQVLRLLVELGAQFVGADEGSLLVLDEEKQELVFAMTVGSDPSEKALVGQRVPVGKGITGLAAQTREVQIGAPTFRTRQARKAKGKEEQPKAVLAAPMLIADRLIGAITAVSFQPRTRFSSRDALLYARIAAVAAVVVEQRRRLSAIEALEKGEGLPRAMNDDERLEHQILDAVTRLVRSKPAAKARIARLLSDIQALAGE